MAVEDLHQLLREARTLQRRVSPRTSRDELAETMRSLADTAHRAMSEPSRVDRQERALAVYESSDIGKLNVRAGADGLDLANDWAFVEQYIGDSPVLMEETGSPALELLRGYEAVALVESGLTFSEAAEVVKLLDPRHFRSVASAMTDEGVTSLLAYEFFGGRFRARSYVFLVELLEEARNLVRDVENDGDLALTRRVLRRVIHCAKTELLLEVDSQVAERSSATGLPGAVGVASVILGEAAATVRDATEDIVKGLESGNVTPKP